jgi:hypothetical protein
MTQVHRKACPLLLSPAASQHLFWTGPALVRLQLCHNAACAASSSQCAFSNRLSLTFILKPWDALTACAHTHLQLCIGSSFSTGDARIAANKTSAPAGVCCVIRCRMLLSCVSDLESCVYFYATGDL